MRSYDVNNFTHRNESFTKFVICPKCSHIYSIKDAIAIVGTQQSSKYCSYIAYRNHPQPSRRTPCQALLMKNVTTVTQRRTLYPFKFYCYTPYWESNDFYYSPSFSLTANFGVIEQVTAFLVYMTVVSGRNFRLFWVLLSFLQRMLLIWSLM